MGIFSKLFGPTSAGNLSGTSNQNKGVLFNTFDEWFNGPNQFSNAGLQRAENLKARSHATEERMASEKFNQAEAQKNRDWQEYMSNTSYQRMMSDLKEAGINPYFAIQGGGASTPSGSTASSSAHPSGANSTKDPLGMLVPLIGLIMGGINTGATLSQRSADNMAKILSTEKVAGMKMSSIEKVANLKISAQEKDNIARILSNEKISADRISSAELINKQRIKSQEKMYKTHKSNLDAKRTPHKKEDVSNVFQDRDGNSYDLRQWFNRIYNKKR